MSPETPIKESHLHLAISEDPRHMCPSHHTLSQKPRHLRIGSWEGAGIIGKRKTKKTHPATCGFVGVFFLTQWASIFRLFLQPFLNRSIAERSGCPSLALWFKESTHFNPLVTKIKTWLRGKDHSFGFTPQARTAASRARHPFNGNKASSSK